MKTAQLMRPKTEPICVTIRADQNRMLRELAHRNDRSLSGEVRQAIDRHLLHVTHSAHADPGELDWH